MRSLNRQKVKIYYSKYSGNVEVMDEDGDYTGEKTISYATPVGIDVSLSPDTGVVTSNPFGIKPEYDRVMIVDDVNCPIDENTIIWINKPTTGSNDYVVMRVSKTLNCVSYGLKKVCR